MKPNENHSEQLGPEAGEPGQTLDETARAEQDSSVRAPDQARDDSSADLSKCAKLIDRVRRNSPFCLADLVADAAGPMWLAGEQAGGERAGDVETGNAETETAKEPQATTVEPNRPKQIGRFQVKELVGQGGFGLVFRAIDPRLGRDVALKIPRVETLLTDRDHQRFLDEAKTVSTLNHPAIAAVYEAGYAGPICYMASAYYSGGSLAQALSVTGPWSPQLAAQMTRTLALAVQHAHSRGVLHRDMKPGNVLFDSHAAIVSDLASAPAAARIVDFGLAKLVDRQQDLTQTGALIGTPAYMSPEQADGRHQDVSSAADIYGLGAILYELLTGRPPFQHDSLLATLEAVRSDEPVAPRLLQGELPRDLEAICLKCLEKSPERRYATARGLANDLGRYLRGDMVQARPLSRARKTIRWCRRYPAWTALGTTLMVGVVAVAAVSTVAYLQVAGARDALVESNQALRHARDAEAHRAEQLRASLDAQVSIVLEDLLGRQTELTDEHRKYLQAALVSYEQFAAEQGFGGEVQAAVAAAHARVGDIHARLGDLAAAEEAYQQALERYASLLEDSDARPDWVYKQSETQTALAHVWELLGRTEDAERALREALDATRTLVTRFPANADYRQLNVSELASLGNTLKNSRRVAPARDLFRDAIELQQAMLSDQPDDAGQRAMLAKLHGSLAQTLTLMQRLGDAEQTIQKAITIQESLVAECPNDPSQRELLAHLANGHAFILLRQGRSDEAESVLREQLTVRRELADMFPLKTDYQLALIAAYVNFGTIMVQTHRPDEAEQIWRSAERVARRILVHQSQEPYHHYALANVLLHLAQPTLANGETDKALELASEGATQLEVALEGNPNRPDFLRARAEKYQVMAQVLAARGQHEKAAAQAEQMLLSPFDPIASPLVAARVFARCALLAEADDAELAEHYRDRAVDSLRQAIDHGFTRRESITTHPDLKTLRARPDVQELMQRIGPDALGRTGM